MPPPVPLTLSPAQSLPLPRPEPSAVWAGSAGSVLERPTPLFWAMHRGRGGMQYALRVGVWKLLGGYGAYATRGSGPKLGGEVVPWLRTGATIGRVELYLLSHDPAERVDLSAARPDVVALLLPRLTRLLHETARDGPNVTGWTHRGAACPRFVLRFNNITEHCCQPLRASVEEEVEPGTLISAAAAPGAEAGPKLEARVARMEARQVERKPKVEPARPSMLV